MSVTVNDSQVKLIIDRALLAETSHAETIVHSTSRAFRALQQRRREVEPRSMDLAAAEHYMYARFLAGVTGDPLVRMAPTLYGLKKRLYFALGIQDRMATTGQPVLPPSADVERWGRRGADDGLRDYQNVHRLPSNNYGKAAESLAGEAARYN